MTKTHSFLGLILLFLVFSSSVTSANKGETEEERLRRYFGIKTNTGCGVTVFSAT